MNTSMQRVTSVLSSTPKDPPGSGHAASTDDTLQYSTCPGPVCTWHGYAKGMRSSTISHPPRRLLKSQTSGGCKKKSAGQHALDSLTRAHASRARPRPHQRAARWWCDRSSGATCGVRAVVTARAEAAAAWAAHDAAKRETHDRCRWLVRPGVWRRGGSMSAGDGCGDDGCDGCCCDSDGAPENYKVRYKVSYTEYTVEL